MGTVHMTKPITWGILGTGDIARQMAEDLRLVPGATLRAVASRTEDRARAFGETHGIPVCYGEYAALVQDPDIDVVYIATPHPRHCEDALLCFEHGKHVLCEKPLAMNTGEVDRMFDAAAEHDCFLMEAMWTAFFPAIQGALADLRSGRLGEPRLVTADFSYKTTAGPESRLFNPALGGGALLDIGIYTVALAEMVFGEEPSAIYTSWTAAATGVDESAAFILDYGPGQRAILSTSLAFDAPQVALVAATGGTIQIPDRFSQPDSYVRETGGQRETITFDRQGYGYHQEARAVSECVRAGQKTSETVPPAMTRRITRTLDQIREQWGLRYPMEEAGG